MKKIKLLLTAASIAIFATSMAQAGDTTKLTDPQIAHIAYTAGDIDIKTAELALKKTSNKEVKAFAEGMVRDHKAVNDQALALVKKLNVTPEDNDTSKSLVKQADETRAKLEKLNGADFDHAYAANEVAYHHTVNSTLETVLIPSSNNKELKDFLSTGLKLFKGHEEHANKVVTQIK